MILVDAREEAVIPPPVDLREVIIRLTHSDEVMLPAFIGEIALGTYGDEAEGLLERTMADPEKLERGRAVFVTDDQRVLIQTRDLIGEHSEDDDGQSIRYHFTSYVNTRARHREGRKKMHLVTVEHAHPFPYPPSMADLKPILLTPDDLSSQTMVYTISEEGHILVFRGLNTPRFSPEHLEPFIEGAKWRIKEITMRAAMLGMPGDANKIIQDMAFAHLARMHDLQVFHTPIGERTARRVEYEE